jgi:hypothetical protein
VAAVTLDSPIVDAALLGQHLMVAGDTAGSLQVLKLAGVDRRSRRR